MLTLKFSQHEWHERPGWYDDVVAAIDRIQVVPDTRSETEINAIRDLTKPEDEPQLTQLPLHRDSIIRTDRDGVLLLAFIKAGQDLPWGPGAAEELRKIPADATLNQLLQQCPPDIPEKKDPRYPKGDRERYEAQGLPYGHWRLGVRRVVGHWKEEPALTAGSHIDVGQGAAVNRWFKLMAPVHQTISQILSVLSPDIYDYQRKILDHWASETALMGYKRTARMAFSYFATLVNARVKTHKDVSDLKCGIAAMICSGNFRNGGNVIIPTLGEQYEMREGDIVFFRGTMLEHLISPYEGERLSMVMVNKHDMSDLAHANPSRTPAQRGASGRKAAKTRADNKRKRAEAEEGKAEAQEERPGKRSGVPEEAVQDQVPEKGDVVDLTPQENDVIDLTGED